MREKMNNKFTEEQIQSYAKQFREGDAVWAGDKWNKVITLPSSKAISLGVNSPINEYIVNYGMDMKYRGSKAGFSSSASPYRLITLDDYKLQGGEKIVWLGENNRQMTFGKAYIVNEHLVYEGDEEYTLLNENLLWGVIPQYEQVKDLVGYDRYNLGEETISGIKIVDEAEFTDKFKIGDKVKIVAVTKLEKEESFVEIGETGVVTNIDTVENDYHYEVQLNDDKSNWFNEATLELVTEKNISIESKEDKIINSLNESESTTTKENTNQTIQEQLQNIANELLESKNYEQAIEIINVLAKYYEKL